MLLIEDDAIMGESLYDRFSLEGFVVDWVKTIASASLCLDTQAFDVVVCDVRLPDGSGEALFTSRGANEAAPPWLFITAFATVDQAVAMLRAGAKDYVTKPFDIAQLVAKVRACTGLANVLEPVCQSAEDSQALGISDAMKQLAAQAKRVALRARTVLVTGESGSGKEVLARHIHGCAHSNESAPFVAVNCGAIPEGLVEAAFFGHERGAFTGADRMQRGYFEQAHGGTLFLDEIGELSLSMQVRLLRVLQERRVQRVGAESMFDVHIRVICATHRDLRELVEMGKFREDLFYRINVVHLRVPALRERPDDVVWLAQCFLADQARERSEPQRRLAIAARAALIAYTWPGNVRELQNRIESAIVLTDKAELDPCDLFDDRSAADISSPLPTLDAFVADAEKEYLASVLSRFDGRVGDTAQALGISRKTLWEKTKRHGLRAL
jgi:DNA-binding NtrC family response regulator